jgi:hypothetical protein
MNTITIPTYLLDNYIITDLIDKAQDVMVELAGEQHTPELQLRAILTARSEPKGA